MSLYEKLAKHISKKESHTAYYKPSDDDAHVTMEGYSNGISDIVAGAMPYKPDSSPGQIAPMFHYEAGPDGQAKGVLDPNALLGGGYTMVHNAVIQALDDKQNQTGKPLTMLQVAQIKKACNDAFSHMKGVVNVNAAPPPVDISAITPAQAMKVLFAHGISMTEFTVSPENHGADLHLIVPVKTYENTDLVDVIVSALNGGIKK